MLFDTPTVYYCPSCNKPMLKTNYMSYTVHGSTSYSDGERTGYPNFTPNLAKCPNCGAVFFLHNLWAKREDVPYEERQCWKNIDDPALDDYIKVVEQGLAKTADEEIEARTCLWRTLNNITRNGGSFGPDTMKLWHINCEKLLSLQEQKLKEIMQTAELDAINNLRITIIELRRNLGRFDEVLRDIKELPETYDWLARQFAGKCKKQDRMVFQIKYKNDNPDGDNYFIDEDGEERYYLDPDAVNPDFGKILSHWNKEIEEDDDLPENWKCRAYVYLKKGDFHSALSDISRAIELNSDDDEYYRLRAQIYGKLGDSEMKEWNLFRARHIKTFAKRSGGDMEKAAMISGSDRDSPYLFEADGQDNKPLILIEEFWDVIQNSAGDIMFCIQTRDGEPVQPEILYSGGANALYRRKPDQFILLDEVHPDVREALRNAQEVLIAEFNPADRGDKREPSQIQSDSSGSVIVTFNRKNSGILREYMAKLRPVFETLESVKSIVEDGYPLFTSLRARVYANADKPIAEVIGKEDHANLIAVLAREEDYEQLDRFFAECPVKAENYERLADYMKAHPVNQWVSCLFQTWRPTPLFYVTTKNVVSLLKEPVRILRYLTRNGADPDMESGEGDTPLGNQCCSNGSVEIMRNLLEAGADPELATIAFDKVPIKPLLLALFPPDSDPQTNTFTPLTAENVERVKLLIANGADVNTVWEWELGITPLSLAIAYARGEQQRELVNLLRNRGADVDAALKGLENCACEQSPQYYYALYEFYAGFPNQTEPMPGMTLRVNHKIARHFLALAAKYGYRENIDEDEAEYEHEEGKYDGEL
jgi:tetratricopeptide (TPR) repeat protein